MAKTKVMIVDDSPLILEVVGATLRSAGYDVVTRSVPIGTSAAILRERPALVLMDVSMPLVAGTEISDSLRSSRMAHGSVIVLHSDQPAAQLAELAQQCGADGFIRKTGDSRELLAQVAKWIESRARRAQSRGRGVLVAGNTETRELVHAALGTRQSLQSTDSGAEAYRIACSRSAPRVLVLGTSLQDLRASVTWQKLVDLDSTWRDHIVVVDEGHRSAQTWPAGVLWWQSSEPISKLAEALARATEGG